MRLSYPLKVNSTAVYRLKLGTPHTSAQDLFSEHLHFLNQASLLTTGLNPKLLAKRLNSKANQSDGTFQEFVSGNMQDQMYSKSPMDCAALPWPPPKQDQPGYLIPAHLGLKGGV
jgi:hypothetical protein